MRIFFLLKIKHKCEVQSIVLIDALLPSSRQLHHNCADDFWAKKWFRPFLSAFTESKFLCRNRNKCYSECALSAEYSGCGVIYHSNGLERSQSLAKNEYGLSTFSWLLALPIQPEKVLSSGANRTSPPQALIARAKNAHNFPDDPIFPFQITSAILRSIFINRWVVGAIFCD